MKHIPSTALGLAVAMGLALLLPARAHATPATKTAGTCTEPSAAYTFTVKITLAEDGTPIATPSTNENGTCVEGGDSIAFDTSALPAGATWSASFPSPVAGGIFQNSCTFGSAASESSSCTVIADPPWKTYDYSVTVTANGVSKTLDPHVIVGNGGKKRRHRHHHQPQP